MSNSGRSVNFAYAEGVASVVPPDVERMAIAVARLFQPYVEVVLHDLETGRVAAIWNAMPGRNPGDPSRLAEGYRSTVSDDTDIVMGPFTQIDTRGHRTTSVSVPVGDGSLVLCINFNRSALDGAAAILASLGAPSEEQPAGMLCGDWRLRINDQIDEWCGERHVSARALTRSQRRDLVMHLDATGVFNTRNAVTHVASTLGVSRATVYSLRKQAV